MQIVHFFSRLSIEIEPILDIARTESREVKLESTNAGHTHVFFQKRNCKKDKRLRNLLQKT